MVKVLIREYYGNDRTCETVVVKLENQTNLSFARNRNEELLPWNSLKIFFTSVFLPHGYPESVSEDYIEYQLWDSIQAFASSIMNNLATHAILKGVGVGDSTATVLAATMTWLLRDGTSMVGRILFAYIQSSKLDADSKKWRLFADVINDMAIFIDLLSPYFPNYFTFMQCVSGVSKSLVGTAGGATRAALTQHQARRNNLADVSAKDGSQETLVNLSALICSLIIVPVVSSNANLVWLLFVLFTLLHIYANYRAVKSVSMETFNMSRFAIFIENYLSKNGEIPSVKNVNLQENVWFLRSDRFDECNNTIPIGVSLQTHIKSSTQLMSLIELYKDAKYILTFDSTRKIPINISLNVNFNSLTLLEAVFQASVILFARRTFKTSDHKLQQIIEVLGSETTDWIELLKLSRKYTIDSFEDLSTKATIKGWDLNRVLITPQDWRYEL